MIYEKATPVDIIKSWTYISEITDAKKILLIYYDYLIFKKTLYESRKFMSNFLTNLSSKEKRSKEEELKVIEYSKMITKIGKVLTRNLDIDLGFTFVEPYFNRFLQVCYWRYIISKLNSSSNLRNRVKSILHDISNSINDLHNSLTKAIENLENDNFLTEGIFERISRQIKNLNVTLTINLSELIIAGLVQTEKAKEESKTKEEKKMCCIKFVISKNNSRNTLRSLIVNNVRMEIITPTNWLNGIP